MNKAAGNSYTPLDSLYNKRDQNKFTNDQDHLKYCKEVANLLLKNGAIPAKYPIAVIRDWAESAD